MKSYPKQKNKREPLKIDFLLIKTSIATTQHGLKPILQELLEVPKSFPVTVAGTMRLRKKGRIHSRGFVLIMVVMGIFILSVLGMGLLAVAQGVRQQAVKIKNETISLLAAEAGYERAIFWMSQQPDILTALQAGPHTGSETFANSNCDYTVDFHIFAGSRPIFKITSDGHTSVYNRSVEVYVIQATSGWDMGLCRVPSGTTSTYPVNYANGEIIDLPIHINCYNTPDDSSRDIHIIGSPQFLDRVTMGESRLSAGGTDKYDSIMPLFQKGIYFDQPDSKITDDVSIQNKVDRFRGSTKGQFDITPSANSNVTNPQAAVQLGFYVGADGKGHVQITENCTVRGYKRGWGSTWDYKVVPGTDGKQYEKYHIYGYHYIPENAEATGQRYTVRVSDTEVTTQYGSVQAAPGGQIFVNGNVVIGSNSEKITNPSIAHLNTVQGSITVVATGNIWVADSLVVSDRDDSGNTYSRVNGLPEADNPNVLGLVAQGVIKIVDPGQVEYLGGPGTVAGAVYEPIGILDNGYPSGSYHRSLPDPLVVEAALTVGGGGWGAEDVQRGSYGGRKEGGATDNLILHGTLTEVVRGVVGMIGADGYVKKYYLDERLLQGIVPGDIWLKGKFVPTPAGWRDFRASQG